jgi:GNAT superfamily N-acetyltransferase
MEDIRIRPATLEDLPHILRHRRAMLRDMGCHDEAALDRMQAAAEAFVRDTLPGGAYRAWLAEAANRIVSGGAIHIVPWIPGAGDPSPQRAWIHSVYTEPEFRRRGIAKQLMETMVAWCRSQGFRSISLHASDQGRPLYEGLGFQPASEMRLNLY